MKAANSLKELARASEAALGRLGYEYGRGGTQGVVEFTVRRPFAFSVVVEELASPYTHDRLLGFLSTAQTRSNVFISGLEDDPQQVAAASAFVREMVGGLKRKPWKGLGIVSSRTAKILWDRWLEPDARNPTQST